MYNTYYVQFDVAPCGLVSVHEYVVSTCGSQWRMSSEGERTWPHCSHVPDWHLCLDVPRREALTKVGGESAAYVCTGVVFVGSADTLGAITGELGRPVTELGTRPETAIWAAFPTSVGELCPGIDGNLLCSLTT